MIPITLKRGQYNYGNINKIKTLKREIFTEDKILLLICGVYYLPKVRLNALIQLLNMVGETESFTETNNDW